ncbi:acid-sensing ion channel 4-A-like [Xenopus tropicalis]|uniref:Acid-sensing ion channel 4-A-like n=1 Tax=Xenopus tropicalis TaxID=8364 RepID=A0A8J1J7S8_XENTR|nr:acid-sensing ion channel 4-A-like [Xenopus tropicalis]
MPIQIFCTLSFSTEREPRNRNICGINSEEIELVEKDYFIATEPAAFASNCTLHGLNHIVTEGAWGPRRVIWTVSFLLSLSLFLSQVWERVAYYKTYPRLTAIDEMVAKRMFFPAVTFCNCNRFRPSQLSADELLYLAPLIGAPEDGEATFTQTPSDSKYDLYEITDRTSHQLSDMMLECRYQGAECDADDFIPVREIWALKALYKIQNTSL